MDVSEVEINVPWGQITCKIYNKDSIQLVLLLHDLHDNASSFDNLIPHLTKTYIYASVDLPGHGKSSHAPEHSIYYYFDYILSLKYIIYGLLKLYKQPNNNKRVVLLGHGASAHLSMVFTQIYPKLVSRIILLENIYDYGIKSSNFVENLKEIIDSSYFNIEQVLSTKSPLEYSFQEIVNIYRKKYQDDDENSKTIAFFKMAERACRQIANGNYILRNDMRLSNMIMHTCGFDYTIDLYKKLPILCPVLILCNKEIRKQHKELLNVLKMKSKFVSIVKFDKENITRSFHLKQPEKVAEYVNKFLVDDMIHKL